MTSEKFDTRPCCPVCKHTGAKTLYSIPYAEGHLREFLSKCYPWATDDDLYNAKYTLLKCEKCSLIYQKEIPNDYLMSKLYELHNPDEMQKLAQVRKDADYYLAIAREITSVMRWLKKSPHELKLLDFGMGWGEWCLMAKAFGCDAVGSEMSAAKIRVAAENGIKNIAFDEIPRGAWDFISTEQVLEHVPDPVGLLAYLGKSLKPNGLIKVSVPNRLYGFSFSRSVYGDGAFARFHKWEDFSGNSVQPLEHINCFSYKSLLALGAAANLKPVRQPILSQYVCAITGSSGRNLLKNAFKPLYRAIHNNNYMFFTTT